MDIVPSAILLSLSVRALRAVGTAPRVIFAVIAAAIATLIALIFLIWPTVVAARAPAGIALIAHLAALIMWLSALVCAPDILAVGDHGRSSVGARGGTKNSKILLAAKVAALAMILVLLSMLVLVLH